MMRVIIEPKVFVQGVLAQTGASVHILQAWQDARFELVVSDEWLSTVGHLFHQLTPLHQQTTYVVQSFLEMVREFSWEWKTTAVKAHLCDDVVDYIITYDIHIDLQSHEKILTPEELFAYLYPTKYINIDRCTTKNEAQTK